MKERHGLILEVVDNRALVLWGTSFVGREDPKHDHTREEYFRLANRDKTAPPSKARDVPVIRYVGSDFLKKGSFMRHTKPDWVDLEIAPLAYEGSLCNDDFAKVADTMKLPEDHQLRVRGRHELEKQKIAAAESDARRAQRDGQVGALSSSYLQSCGRRHGGANAQQQILPKEPKERALLVEDDEEGDSKGPGAGDGLNVGGSPWLAIAGSHASGS